MARYRVGIFWKAPGDTTGVSSEIVYACSGDGSARDCQSEFIEACARLKIVWQNAVDETVERDHPGFTMEAGIVFGRRGMPQSQRVYSAHSIDEIDSMIDEMRAAEFMAREIQAHQIGPPNQEVAPR